MTIPAGLLALVAVILVLAFVVRPFIQGVSARPEQLTAKQIKAIAAQRAKLSRARLKIYRELVQLDGQFETGNLDEKAYREQRYLLVARGVDVLQQLDRLPQTDRQHLDSRAEALIAAIHEVEPDDTKLHCPNCGSAIHQHDRFCGQCGHALQPQAEAEATAPQST